MSRKSKTLIWLMIFILILSLVFSIATYAYFSTREIYEGTFKVDINSKGVDTLYYTKTDARFEANGKNFAPVSGHDVYGEATLNAILETTNNSANYCYETSIVFPNEQIFSYTIPGVPELVLDVSKSDDGINYVDVVKNMDITTNTGTMQIPVDDSVYKNVITTTKNVKTIQYWKARVTFKWLEDEYQVKNDFKSYKLSFRVNTVEC